MHPRTPHEAAPCENATPATDAWEARARRWLQRPGQQLATAAGLFVVIALVSASQLYVNWRAAGIEASWSTLVGLRLVDALMWAGMTPMVVALDAYLRRRAPSWYRAASVHVAVATSWFALQNAVIVALAPIGDPAAVGQPFAEAYVARAVTRVSTTWLAYAGILAVVALLRDFVRRQRLVRDLYDAQLRVLRSQIHPHFLFNTLHTIGGLVRSGDRDRAIETLVSLSDLLRRSLSHVREHEVPLEEELDFLEKYLAIQRARFEDRLCVDIRVDDRARTARVPPLVLQPLVENAIRHGLDLEHEPGRVAVEVRESGGRLTIRVEDDGGTLAQGSPTPMPSAEGGIGLTNLRDRLGRLYGAEHELELSLTEDGATVVRIDIPLRRV